MLRALDKNRLNALPVELRDLITLHKSTQTKSGLIYDPELVEVRKEKSEITQHDQPENFPSMLQEPFAPFTRTSDISTHICTSYIDKTSEPKSFNQSRLASSNSSTSNSSVSKASLFTFALCTDLSRDHLLIEK